MLSADNLQPGAVAGAVLAMAILAILSPPTNAYYNARWERDDGNYLVGSLTWTGGVGRITWSGAPSEDPGGPTEAENDTYRSEPLPHRLYVNGSRLIQVDIFTKGISSDSGGTSCFGTPTGILGAELRAGGALLGGSETQTRFETREGHPEAAQLPPDPPGHGVCRFRFAAELTIIPEGSVLELRLRRNPNGDHVPYGMAGDHQSVIRVPRFSDAELPFRHPSYAHPRPPDAETGALDLSVLGAGSAALPLLAASRMRRGARSQCVAVVVVLALSLSGCLGARPGPAGSGLDKPTVELSPDYQRVGTESNGTTGLFGQVLAGDTLQGVHGAHVALLGTPASTSTNPFGEFSFQNLQPGDYTLRVDKGGYVPFEGSVTVVSDFIARVNITVAPIGAAGSAQRPHVHDYWPEGQTTFTLVDNLSLPSRLCLPPECLIPGVIHPTGFSIPEPGEDAFRSVLPGTSEVLLTFFWDPQKRGNTNVFLDYLANHDASLLNVSHMFPRGPGQPFRIATSWEMTDPGHQRFSTWFFNFGVYGSYPRSTTDSLTGDALRAVEPPPFTVTVKIVKGTVPFEPAHPERWGEERTRAVLPPSTKHSTLFRLYGTGVYKDSWNFAWTPGIVPVGTTRLDVYANLTRPPTVDYQLELRYRTAAAGAPTSGCWPISNADDNKYNGDRCEGSDFAVADKGTRSGTSTHWSLVVTSDQPDPFYALRSFWVFALRPATDPVNGYSSAAEHAAAGARSPEVTLLVLAHRGDSL